MRYSRKTYRSDPPKDRIPNSEMCVGRATERDGTHRRCPNFRDYGDLCWIHHAQHQHQTQAKDSAR